MNDATTEGSARRCAPPWMLALLVCAIGAGGCFRSRGSGPTRGDPGDAGPADMALEDMSPDAGAAVTPTPELTETVPASPGDSPTPVIVGTAAPDAELRLFTNGDCTGEPQVVRVVPGAFGLTAGVDAGETVFSADARLPGAERSACSAPLAYRFGPDAEEPLAVPVFPPAPALTELPVLTLRARVDATPGDEVRFVGPDGAVAASYDARTDSWEARVALRRGWQTVQVAVGERAEETFSLARAAIPAKVVALGVDSASGRLLVADTQLDERSDAFRYRVLEVEPATGLAQLRTDLGVTLREVHAMAADEEALFITGRTDLGSVVLRDEGRGAEVLTRYDERSIADPVFLALRGDELIVYATAEGVSFVDRASGLRRAVEVAPPIRTCDAAYDPVRDVVLLCPKSRVPGYETLVPGESAATVTEIEAERGMLELAWDGFAERLVGRDDRYGAYELDLEAGIARPLGTMPTLRGFIVAPRNGVVVGLAELERGVRDRPLRTFDPATERAGELDLGAVGSGPALSGPWAVVRVEDRVLLADVSGAVDVPLGAESGTRRATGIAGGSSWRSLALEPGTTHVFAMTEAGAIDRIDLATGEVTRVVADGTGFPFHEPTLDVGAGTLVYADDVTGDVVARDLDALDRVRQLAPRASDGPVFANLNHAVAVEPTRAEAFVLQRASSLDDGSFLRIVAVPLDGSGGERVLDGFPGEAASTRVEATDVAATADMLFVAYQRTFWAIDPDTGAPRYERTMPGEVREVTAPGEDGVGFMTTFEGRGLLAFDGATGEWAVIAR